MPAEQDDSAQVVADLAQAAGGGDGLLSAETHPIKRSASSRRIADFMRRSFRFKRSPSTPYRSQSSPATDKKSTNVEEVDLMPSGFFRRQDSVIYKVRPGQYFTSYADIVVDQPHKAPANLGNLGELKHLTQTGRAKQVKKYIRANQWPIGHRVRAELWKELCKDSERGGRISLYREKIDQLVASGVKTLKPSFLSSEGMVVHDYSLKEEGAVSLQRLLTVVECVRPDITHVPILYPLAALFLHYMSEEDAFACVMRLLLASSQKFLMQTEIATIASRMTLLALVKKHRSAAYQFLRQQTAVEDDDRLTDVFADWMAWIFRDLPFQHLIRVVDCFLFEGQKVLFRVALALVDLWAKHRKQMPPLSADESMERLTVTVRDISDFVRNLPVPPESLLKSAFGVRNLKGGQIKRLQERNELAARQNPPNAMSSKKSLTEKQNTKGHHYYSDISFRSSILSPDTVSQLISALPGRLQLLAPRLAYRLSQDGASFTSFWGKVDSADQTIIIIRSVTGEAFGAYCSSSWSERRDKYERAKTRFFGTGESFVWSLEPEVGALIPYRWSGTTHEQPESCPQMFQAAGDTWFVIGGGGGEAIAIYDELSTGVTSNCHTFGSPPLVRDGTFEIDDLEVFAVPSGCDD